MKPSNLTRRLEALEGRTPPATSTSGPSAARRRMLYHLAQVARFRRGQLSEDEAAEVEALNAAVELRFRESRGEGSS